MTQPLEFRFALTKDEFVRNARWYYVRRPSTWILLVLLVVLAITQWSAFYVSPLLFVVAAGLPLLLYVTVLFLIVPWLLGRQVQRNERMRVEMNWRVTDDRIAVSSAHGESWMDWGTFQRVVETPHAYLLIFATNKNMFQIVPKRALTPEQRSVFEQLLAQKLSAPRAASA